ncbi:MAG: hypothetical protein EOP34_06340 [Rickettsiales bacterium]|nr:MAG: hypothetical protein EOP34_06340 [Rickettsiales bacterium]
MGKIPRLIKKWSKLRHIIMIVILQLGMMVIAVGLSSYGIALFHLVNHAFYKALLFLGAGAVIHAVADNQDFRRYGGLRPFLPLTYSVMLIASLSLVAFPFMTGFYSKDFILESAYGQYYFSGTVVYIIATIGAMFTTLYSVKVLYLTFLTNPNGPLINYKNAHEGDIFMSLPLMILAVFSIFFGFVTKDMFIGLGSGFFSDNALFIHPSHEIMLDTEFGVATLFKLLPLMFTISLSVIAILLSEFLSTTLISFKLSRTGYNIFSFFNQRFLIELFYNRFITGIVLKLGGQTTRVLDKGSVEYIGPYGLEKGLLNISSNISNLNTGSVTTYALYITTGIVMYMLFSSYVNPNIFILSIFLASSLLLFKNNKPSLPLQSAMFTINKNFIFGTIPFMALVFLAVYLSSILDGLAYSLSTLLYNSDAIGEFSAGSYNQLSAKVDKFDKKIDEISSIKDLREKSCDNIDLLNKQVEEERANILQEKNELTSELKEAVTRDASLKDDVEEKIQIVKDSCTVAVQELDAAATEAREMIEDGHGSLINEALFLVVGNDIFVLPLFSALYKLYKLNFFSVAYTLYMSKE